MINKEQPKLLFLDLENSPIISYNWKRWESDAIAVQQESYILSFAYKFLGDKKTHVLALPDFKGYKPNTTDDKKLMIAIHKIVSRASILCGQNSDAFDIKKLNTRFIYHGLTPIDTYKTIDTLKIAKQRFSFSSNSLNELGKYLKLGEKVKTGGFDLWLQCMAGNKKSWRLMKKYNKMDVILLEKVYNKLAPWIKTYPKVSDPKTPTKEMKCSNCGKQCTKNGVRRCIDYSYVRLYCPFCGHWSRGPDIIEKKVKK